MAINQHNQGQEQRQFQMHSFVLHGRSMGHMHAENELAVQVRVHQCASHRLCVGTPTNRRVVLCDQVRVMSSTMGMC